MEAHAIALFGDTARVRQRIAELADKQDGYASHNQGKVFFCLTLKELVEDCGHYLLYGSEYLLCVANSLGLGNVLRERGKATVVECNVPVEQIPLEYMECLCGMLLAVIAEKYCTRRSEELGHAGF